MRRAVRPNTVFGTVHRRRFILAYATVALFAVVAVGAPLLLVRNARNESKLDCSRPLPTGSGVEAIQATTALWVTDVLMRQHPGCGYRLASSRLRQRLARDEWAAGKSPVTVVRTRYPVVPYAQARDDSPRTQAVFAISRRFHDVVSVRGDGEYEAAMAAGIATPDAGLAAFNLLLRLEGGSWHVDRSWRVPIDI
jgi:hypothetical protein